MAQVLIERDSRRPWPESEAVCWTAMSRHGRAASWQRTAGWLPAQGFRLYAMEISPPVSVWICEMRGRYIGGTAGEPSWTRLSISVPPKVTGFIEIW